MKKEKLVRKLEKRSIISFNEFVEILGSINTAKHYVLELKRYGVLKYRDIVRVEGKRVVVYFISHKGLEEYKVELQRRKEKKANFLRSLRKH